MNEYDVPKRRPHLELVSVDGSPTVQELQVISDALDHLIDVERQSGQMSMWLRAGRSTGRRLGMFDYRDRFEREDAWRLSTRFPFGGREYQGLAGRGDVK